MKFLHLSDLHYGKSSRGGQRANAMLKDIHQKFPNHRLIITGDITNDGKAAQYRAAERALPPFAGKVYVAPGNHDYGRTGWAYSAACSRRFNDGFMLNIGMPDAGPGNNYHKAGDPVVSYLKYGETRVALIGLDSNVEVEGAHDFARGAIGARQRNRLDLLLDEIDAYRDGDIQRTNKIVYFHHHLYMHGRTMELLDAAQLLQVIGGRVDVVLFGHRHRWGNWQNVHGIKRVLSSANTPKSVTLADRRHGLDRELGSHSRAALRHKAPVREISVSRNRISLKLVLCSTR